ncbi:hypothetical protein WICPIJ_005637 [Wickerhamomyces pijperi]|uniref:Uncharacterized protein n=1 Tax=Wickerhamomyces pijperi TaxID=599730 RepID=A0A9P8TKY6_WICPI|nr:hypothetical protein WICPIJ_005637 [Wickerhamomyces pijperi]
MASLCLVCSPPTAARTIKKAIQAIGTPMEIGKLEARMKGINFFLDLIFSLAVSMAEVADRGYSPPIPVPVIPLAMIKNQNKPTSELDLAQAHKMEPMTIKAVEKAKDGLRPKRSARKPKET